jgi:hypothetical protein
MRLAGYSDLFGVQGLAVRSLIESNEKRQCALGRQVFQEKLL